MGERISKIKAWLLRHWKPVAVGLTVLMVAFMVLTTRPLKGGPHSIVTVELACNVEKANRFFDDWKNARADWQVPLRESLKWDTGVILTYAPLLALLCWMAARELHDERRLVRNGVMGAVVVGQILAGGLDFVENAGIRHMIAEGRAVNPWPQVTFLASAPKWLLLIAGTVLIVSGFIHWIRRPKTL